MASPSATVSATATASASPNHYGGKVDSTLIAIRDATPDEIASLTPSTADSVVLYKSYINSGLRLPLTPLVAGILSWFDIAPCQVNANFYRTISVASAAIPLLRKDLLLTPELFLNCYKLARKRKADDGTTKPDEGPLLRLFVRPRYNDFAPPGGSLPSSDKTWTRHAIVATGQRLLTHDLQNLQIRSFPNLEVDLGKPPPPMSEQDAAALMLLRRGKSAKFDNFLKTAHCRKKKKKAEPELEMERSSLIPLHWSKKSRSAGQGKRCVSDNGGAGQTTPKRRELFVSSFYTETPAMKTYKRKGSPSNARQSSPKHNKTEASAASDEQTDIRTPSGSASKPTEADIVELPRTSAATHPEAVPLRLIPSKPSPPPPESPAQVTENQRGSRAVMNTTPIIPLKPDGTPVTQADSILECPAAASGAAGMFCLPRDVELMEGASLDTLMSTGSIFISRAMTLLEIGAKRLRDTQKSNSNSPSSAFGFTEKERLKAEVEALRKQCVELKNKTESDTSEVRQLECGETPVEESSRAGAMAIAELRAQKEELYLLLERSGVEIAAKNTIIRELEGAVGENTQLKAVIDGLKKQCSDLETKAAIDAAEVRRLEDELSTERAKLELQLAESRSSMTFQTAAITGLHAEKDELSQLLERCRQEILLKNSVIRELGGVKMENDELKSKVEALMEQCAELKARADSDTDQIRQLNDQMNTERAKAEKEVEEARSEIASHVTAITGLQAEKDGLSRLLEQVKDEMATKGLVIRDLEGAVEESQKLKPEVELLMKQCFEFKTQIYDYSTEVRQLEEQLNTERGTAETALAEANTKASAQAAAITALQGENAEKSRLLEQSRDEIAAQNSVIGELQGAISKLEAMVATSMQREGIIKSLRDSALLAEQLADSDVKRARKAGYDDGVVDGKRMGWKEFVELQQRVQVELQRPLQERLREFQMQMQPQRAVQPQMPM